MVTANAGNEGSIKPSGSIQLLKDITYEFEVLAQPGYKISKVDGCGGIQAISGDAGSYFVSRPTSNCTITARFIVDSEKTFDNPMYLGYRLDICHHWNSDCRKIPADAFCNRNGYTKATSWKEDPRIGKTTPTFVVADGQVCAQDFCGSFKYIKCSK